ncbi:MAG TPA: L-threonylcarbamoyladenylate synthase [Bacteroidales bacterium]|nr:L-threonylcarbamoyladenylate synthase [Bacteroidales bacterium]HRZ50184.1 L-threonylcarbamoyladenylate synthase [Bacteroidales bacterium]
MLIRIYPDNPSEKLLDQAVEVLLQGGIIIYPTDSVYAMGCSILKPRAVEKLAWLKGVKPEKSRFSFIFCDLTDLSMYTRPITTQVFKVIKKNTPGPFTFILEANNKIPKLLTGNRKTIGIRIPDNSIAREIVRRLGHPMMSSSVHDDDEILEYTTDPELIHERYENEVDLVIDGGYGDNHVTTLVDCTDDRIEIVREGKEELLFI